VHAKRLDKTPASSVCGDPGVGKTALLDHLARAKPVSGQRLAIRGGNTRARPDGRDGAPAWSAAWTAAATSCAVSASMTMFRRSSTRRTTCPACGGASSGPMAAGEGPVASGSVTPGTLKDTVLARLPDTPYLRRL